MYIYGRSPKVRITYKDTGCVVCEGKKCIDDNKICIVRRTTTRRMTKFLQDMRIIIYETYRCMPLLGDEKDNAPGWEEHIVRYNVVFVKKSIS